MFCWMRIEISSDCGERQIHVLVVLRSGRRNDVISQFSSYLESLERVQAQYSGSTPWICIMQGSSSRGGEQPGRTLRGRRMSEWISWLAANSEACRRPRKSLLEDTPKVPKKES